MADLQQLATQLRARADEYEMKAAGALTREAQSMFRTTALSYRSMANRIEANPPAWLHAT